MKENNIEELKQMLEELYRTQKARLDVGADDLDIREEIAEVEEEIKELQDETMEENSIEKITFVENEIKNTRRLFEEVGCHTFFDEDLCKAIEQILSEYKKVLKENEELKIIKSAIQTLQINSLEEEKYIVISKGSFLDGSYKHLLDDYIPKQRVKDIIDRIDYDIEKTKEIISKNTNINASYRKNDYQIVRLRAMNTKSLDIKKRLQELLESEE